MEYNITSEFLVSIGYSQKDAEKFMKRLLNMVKK